MSKKWNYAAVAAVFFLLGMLLSPSAPLVRSVRSKFRYTRGVAQRLFRSWDKESLVFAADGKTFESFERENEQFILYFWATWCPYCRDCTDIMQSVATSAKIPFAALSFDDDKAKFAEYQAENTLYWNNIVQKSADGWDFVKREKAYNIPLIPSVWLVENGKVKRIFVGSEQISMLGDYLLNENLMTAGAEPIFDEE